jgi:putative transposase
MSRKRFAPEQIIGILREADVKLSQGRSVEQLCRELGITGADLLSLATGARRDEGAPGPAPEGSREGEHASQEGGGDLTLDKLILKEALEGNF